MRILVTGRTGQVATALAAQARHHSGVSLLLLGRPEFELERLEEAFWRMVELNPDLIVNTAAYTAVDKAEIEAERAFAVNRDGASIAARAAARLKVPFVHLSTDYVFDGHKTSPYCEVDETTPLNIYGYSKLEGERAVLANYPKALILRTSWIYSLFGSNFLMTMLRIGAVRSTLKVVNDQFGSPTSALDLADAVLKIAPRLRDEPGGLYHLAGSGSASWYEFASFIFSENRRLGRVSPLLEAISRHRYPSVAIRPADTRLCCARFEERFGFKLSDWRQATSSLMKEYSVSWP